MLKATRKQADPYKSKLKVSASHSGPHPLPVEVTAAEEEQAATFGQTSPQKLSLKGSQLGGSILIGNYNYLTQLEVCENEMEVLDLSSLAQLETLKCSRNKLMELIINGTNLQTLVADHNYLHNISTTNTHPVPLKLQRIDISHNNFSELPNWVGACASLTAINASHNRLNNVAVLLRNYRITELVSLDLAYNDLKQLDQFPEGFSSIRSLQLQSNELPSLPDNFFAVTHARLETLNVSCNKLSTLPRYEQNNHAALVNLSLAGNHLNDSIFEPLHNAAKLRVLHLAYNRIGVLPAACVRNWPELEILVLSGNMLQQLPEEVATLGQLRVLRCCNNLLLCTPQLAKLAMLKVLDLSHNHLDRVNLLALVPSRNLKYLDLSGNLQLQVDEQQFKVCQSQSQRHWSLVDVSGNNRAALPTTKIRQVSAQRNQNKTSGPWTMGFAETPGSGDCRKLSVYQLRAANYGGSDEALYGMFEALEGRGRAAQEMSHLVPDLMKQEQMVKDSAVRDYMKFTLLAAQQQCGSVRSAALFHLTRTRAPSKVRPLKSKRYVLRMASTGGLDAYLIRRTSQLRLTKPDVIQKDQIHSMPDPHVLELILSNDDEYLVVGNAQLWSVMDIDRAAREIRKEENSLLAAKRLVDIAQSFAAAESLSVIVVRFRHLGTDVDHLIRELKQSVRKKPQPVSLPLSSGSVCKRTCCDRSNACRHRAIEQEPLAGRSSPSGQSDRDLLAKDKDDEFVLAHARVLQEEQQLEMLDETESVSESVLSEEQFKCWEYMLEQNTQLLFDKELNTISKSFTKQRTVPNAIMAATVLPERNDFTSNLMRTVTNKFISTSTPQLPQPITTSVPLGSYHQVKQAPPGHFGSALSFQQAHSYGYNLFDAKPRPKFHGGTVKRSAGPNSAYFGSLQRLMPYNFEYDFAVTQERERNILDEEEHDDDDFNEHESRMRKYWGVATTEL
uniref:Protein phosphatase PHLPP-like protein n=2 Tax=Drosophila melanogaster TaxID=7227 RepID=PHLPP_DROME|nr:PH domain leucine-rich repeat protein phosphatase, isoform B [Drosophila melanogaster]NP_609938.1 PH domain leucine-rich repeat protein phosphatase, isoform A [Drosophila melanogaster]Q9VJ07.1 RecName: Full=Protein phosphatase PHLPP-like protein; AltName: Full=PH domain leucine-rich repeat protein phosphatase; AltName: Full=dPHLPP [Drosophila melanogaster]AAF53751.1 PH domain leucine-rich repeat protein phosphatase, isoform A [Drosophila melanogaster]AGB93093.1 PH domain leucine-rich repeat |eukprot:NP_001260558.1 PH domain leucine-rich repeat protein phosphatase, isoform B [Drosophila melanogaster]